jgi:hypothetical protein
MWIIAWKYNGKSYIEQFMFYEDAMERLMELTDNKRPIRRQPSLHYVEEKVY